MPLSSNPTVGADIITMTGTNFIPNLDMQGGDDTLTMDFTDTLVGNIIMGPGSDTFLMSGNSLLTGNFTTGVLLVGGAGDTPFSTEIVDLSGNARILGTVTMGDGDSTFSIAGTAAVDGGVNIGDGSNTINIQGGTIGNTGLTIGNGGGLITDVNNVTLNSGILSSLTFNSGLTSENITITTTFDLSGLGTISTGDGTDTISLQGNVQGFDLNLGRDSDTFIVDTPSSGTIDGGEGLNDGSVSGDIDVIDLSAFTAGVDYTIVFDPLDMENGTINFTGGDVITFSNIETIVCFTRDTHIDTLLGPVRVQDLAVGDMVRTVDHGLQPIRWIGTRKLNTHHLNGAPQFYPIRIKAGALGDDLPITDLSVSPQHRMLLSSYRAELMFGEHEVLATAKSLCIMDGVYTDHVTEVEYFHILFDAHEIIFAEGSPSESFHPGTLGMSTLDSATRCEIYELFPEMSENRSSTHKETARICLKTYEVDAMIAMHLR
ncbi:hypothetical protein MNBD_ALPHA07-1774 [hydrothermal vent metagenome]|uniref:Hedgehog/Intein (Hint) domain-containing protein n=1 Tax=hydrothermal vent metagenome TaxID=652676 RepID=A0A3B0SJ25_9ZZZZ